MQTARRAASRLGRNRAFPRRLPPALGGARIYASTEGGLKYLKRDLATIDPVLTRFATDHVQTGHRVWDVGANLGLFAFVAAASAGPTGHVVCLEPDVWLAGLLRRSARANRGTIAKVDVLAAGAADEVGVASFDVAAGNRATNALSGHGYAGQMGGVRETDYVPVFTLDSLLDTFPAPEVMKIDVEGGEARVLAGAEQLLAGVRPVINIEVGSENQDEVTAVLLRHNYRLEDGETGQPVGHATWTTIATPR